MMKLASYATNGVARIEQIANVSSRQHLGAF